MRASLRSLTLGAVTAVVAIAAGCSTHGSSPLSGQTVQNPSSVPIIVEPTPNSTGVSPRATIHIAYQEALANDSVNTSTVTIALANVSPTSLIAARVFLDQDATGFQILPVGVLAPNTTYEVHVVGRPGVHFVDGRDADDFRFQFTTADVPKIFDATLPDAINGKPYDVTLSTTGGFGALLFTITSGTLPPNLTLDPFTGRISGPAVGNQTTIFHFSILVTVTDAARISTTKTLSVRLIPDVPAPAIDRTTTLANFAAAIDIAPFNANVAITGGLAPFDLVEVPFAGENLPNNVAIDQNPGTQPRLFGNWLVQSAGQDTATFTLQVTDQIGRTSATEQFLLTLSPPGVARSVVANSTTKLVDGEKDVAYTEHVKITGPLGPFTVSAAGFTNGVSGLTTTTHSPVASGGNAADISGTPGAVTTDTFKVSAKDQATRPISVPPSGLSFSVVTGLTIVNDDSGSTLSSGTEFLSDVINSASYSQTISPQGGVGPYHMTVSGSTVSGITAAVKMDNSNSAFVLVSGTAGSSASSGGHKQFTVTLSDSLGGSTSQLFDQRAITPSPSIDSKPGSLPGGKAGDSYSSGSISASGGEGTLTWQVSGSTPSGVGFGVKTNTPISYTGTPTAGDAEVNGNGNYSLTITVIDQFVDRFGASANRTDSFSPTLKIRLSYAFNIYPDIDSTAVSPAHPNLATCLSCHGSTPFAGTHTIDFDPGGGAHPLATGLIGVDDVSCAANGSKNYIFIADTSKSVIANKFGNITPSCGGGMPLGAAATIKQAQKDMLARWINELQNGDNN